MSHIIRSHATPPHLVHAAHPFQTAYWWTCPLYAPASPHFLMSFRLMKECVAHQFGSSYNRSVFLISKLILCHHGTLQPHYKHIGLCLTFTMWVSKNVSAKMMCTSSISHNVKSLPIPISHIIRSHATPSHLVHVAHPSQTAYWWACLLYAPANPNNFVSFRLMKECVATL